MNEKYFRLPQEKRQGIEKAAYRVFAGHGYNKSPVAEIANEAGISKSLLFHYFMNKKELYLYLCKQAEELTRVSMTEYEVLQAPDLFEMMSRNIQVKCDLIRRYPHICAFTLSAYYETAPDIRDEVLSIFAQAGKRNQEIALQKIEEGNFRQDMDARVMYQNMQLACEGYLYRMSCSTGYRKERESGSGIQGQLRSNSLRDDAAGPHLFYLDAQQLETDFKCLTAHWKNIYGRESNHAIS